MKKVVFGGMIFIGGVILFSVALLSIAYTEVPVEYMLIPKCIGTVPMIGGLVIGFWVLKEKN